MSRNSKVLIPVFTVLLLLTFLAFQNCSKQQDGGSGGGSGNGPVGPNAPPPFQATANQPNRLVQIGSTVELSVSAIGGKEPYMFIWSDCYDIMSTCTITADAIGTRTVYVSVEDSSDIPNKADLSFTIQVQAGPTPTPTATPVPPTPTPTPTPMPPTPTPPNATPTPTPTPRPRIGHAGLGQIGLDTCDNGLSPWIVTNTRYEPGVFTDSFYELLDRNGRKSDGTQMTVAHFTCFWSNSCDDRFTNGMCAARFIAYGQSGDRSRGHMCGHNGSVRMTPMNVQSMAPYKPSSGQNFSCWNNWPDVTCGQAGRIGGYIWVRQSADWTNNNTGVTCHNNYGCPNDSAPTTCQ